MATAKKTAAPVDAKAANKGKAPIKPATTAITLPANLTGADKPSAAAKKAAPAAKKAAAAVEKKDYSTPTNPRNGDSKIKLLVKENPKRAGSKSFERYALYKDGMKVSDFYAAGGTAADIRWDASAGFIEVIDPK